MKPTLSSLVCSLLALVAVACGDARKGGRPASQVSPPAAMRAALPQIETKGDPDRDSDRYPRELPDRDEIPDYKTEPFGHPAAEADARAAAAVVKRYYADAAGGDGASACQLLYSTRAATVPNEYNRSPDPTKHGITCPLVLSRLFRQLHRQSSADSATLRVGAVRTEFNQASVQLKFGRAKPAHYIMVHRERGVWKMAMLLDLNHPVGVE